MERWAIYIRKSNDDGVLEDTLGAQKEEVVGYAKDNNYYFEDSDVYIETVSGKELLENRKQLVKLLSSIGLYTGIICRDHTRLSRSATTGFHIIDVLASNKKKLIYTRTRHVFEFKETFETIMCGSQFATAGAESSEMMQRLLRGKDIHSARGAWVCSTAPYGYEKCEVEIVSETGKRIKEKSLKIIEDEADVVRLIFKMRLEGQGFQTIAKKLDELGIQSPRRRGWTDQTVRRITENEIYIGVVMWGQERVEKRHIVSESGEAELKAIRVAQTEPIKEKGLHEPIIDKDTWDKVQAMRTHQVRTPTGKQTSPLANLIFCYGCGHALSRQQARGSANPRYTHRANSSIDGCFKAYSKSIQEQTVFEALVKRLKEDLAGIQVEIQEVEDKEETADETQRRILESKIKNDEKRLVNLLDVLTDLQIEIKTTDKIEIVKRQIARIESQCQELEETIRTTEETLNSLGTSKDRLKEKKQLKEAVSVGIEYIEKIMANTDNIQRYSVAINKFLKSFIKRIEVQFFGKGSNPILHITYLGSEDQAREDWYKEVRSRGQKHRGGH